MVVSEQAALSGGGAPYYPGTLALAAKIHNSSGRAWPVSGDRIAVDPAAVDRRALTPKQGTRRLAAGGWLRRSPERVVTVQCEDCSWGLDVQGWNERAVTARSLAQRHADRRNHTVTAKENGR